MNTKYLWWIVGLAAVVMIGWVALGGKSPISNPLASATPKVNASATPKASVKATPKPGVTSIPVPPSNPAYGDAIKTYASTRIQLNAQCQASPSALTIKNGQSIMIDNRSGDARWFAVNGTGYYIAGYGFRILPLSSNSLPATFTIDCGAAQNVARVTVQK
jgi:hypothetical protein